MTEKAKMKHRNTSIWATLGAFLLVMAACGSETDQRATTATSSSIAATTAAVTTPAGQATTSTTADEAGITEQECRDDGGVPVVASDGTVFCFKELLAELEDGSYDVFDVAPNDPDGGLLVWSGPGEGNSPRDDLYEIVGVLPWNAVNVSTTGHGNADGWWYVAYGDLEGWTYSRFLTPSSDNAQASGLCAGTGVGTVPSSAQATQSLMGDFDGDGTGDAFHLYFDATEWYAHFEMAYGFGIRTPVDPNIHFVGAPGSGGPEMFTDMITDMDGDGSDEAWVFDNSPAARDVLSTYVFFGAPDCVIYHVSHHDVATPGHTWLRGASGSGTDQVCVIPGGVIEIHLDQQGNPTSIVEHTFVASAPIGEFYGVAPVAQADLPAHC